MKRKSVSAVFVTAFTFGAIAIAGQMWSTRCGECEHADTFIDRGIRAYSTINGACGKCRQIVTIRWDGAKGHQHKPQPDLVVWDSLRNRDINVYGCPQCDGHFIEVKDVRGDLKYCPSCKKSEVIFEPGPMAD